MAPIRAILGAYLACSVFRPIRSARFSEVAPPCGGEPWAISTHLRVSSVDTLGALGKLVVSTASGPCPLCLTPPRPREAEGVLIIIASGQLCKQTVLRKGNLSLRKDCPNIA